MLDSNSYTDIQTCEILEEEESKEDFLNLKDYEKEIKESESKDEESPSERNKNLTQKIYGLLKKHEYNQVINILNKQLSSDDNSRAVHSVLGYAYFQIANYKQAAEM
jgi:tetratricopeptide (TPR) repeat protein